jgi:C1A family cysteine protease
MKICRHSIPPSCLLLLATSLLLCISSSQAECDDGFIEWQGNADGEEEESPITCFNVDDVTLDLFLDAYDPTYVIDSDDSLSDDDRLELLKLAIQFLLDVRAAQNNGTIPADFELGLTRFAADGEREYKQRSGYVYENVTGTENDLRMVETADLMTLDTLPENIDWVAEGAVTSVKDQGRCGCCWATSLAGAVEGAAYIQNEYFQSMSFQQYVSCNDGNSACDGGSLVIGMGYTWLNEFGGLSTLNEYPYTDYRGKTTTECEVKEKPLAVEIKQPKIAFDVLPVMQFEDRLNLVKSVLAEQPIAMVMKSSCRTLSMYRKGILTDDGDCACLDPYCADHAVLMVGYDDSSDPPSFKLKNSWGKSWGEDGYFRVSQQEAGPWGLFGILGHGVVPGIVTNSTAAVEDEKQKTPLKPWAIILIVLAGFVAIAAISSVVVKVFGGDKGDKGDEDAAAEP